MASVRNMAKNYTPKETLNISECKKIPVDVDVFEVTGTRDDGSTFKYQAVNVNGKDYRMPMSVLKSLKAILEEIPDLEFFRVNRQGTTKENTTYTVIPLRE